MTEPKPPPDTTIIDIEGEVVSSLTVTHTEEGISFGVQINYPVDDVTEDSPERVG